MQSSMLYTILLSGILRASAQQLSECPSGRVEVVENSNSFSLTCSGYSGTVTWSIQTPGVSFVDIGTCSSSCQLNPDLPPGAFTLTSQSSSSSRMTSRATTRPTSDGETTYTCYNQATSSSCSVDIIYPAEVSGCSVKLQENSGTLTVTGSCDVTKVFSSGGNYKCHWFWGDSQSQTESVGETTYSVTSHSDSNYRKGTCTFSSTDLPTGSGSYYYRVVVSPGNTQKSVGSISITEPSTPTISCTPPDWVPANTQLSCTCTTTNIGQPNGRLQWIWIHDGSVLASGTEGATTLTLPPQTVTQGDHGNSRAQFKCRVEWYRDDPSATHTARVAWGPSAVSIPQDRTFDTDSEGSRDLNLTCNPQNVNPGANLMTYSWTGRCQGNTDRCTIRPHPPDDDGLETTCTVTNTYNNNMKRNVTYRLNLNYPPLSPPVIRGYTQPLYDKDHLFLTCEVSGGQPLVNSVNFACLPRHPDNQTDVTDAGSVSSSLNMIVSKDDNGVTCTCGAVWKVDNYYRLTNSINITVFYPTAETHLTLNSQPHNLTVNENDTVLMTCRADGRPTPKMELINTDSRQIQNTTNGGQLVMADRDSWLNHTLSATCQHTGTYRCTAGNGGDGAQATADAMLFVNCAPRRNPKEPLPEVNFRGSAVDLSFDIVAYPVPHNFTFSYYGENINSGNVTAAEENLLDIHCWTSDSLYKQTCNITVDNFTESLAGVYGVHIGNGNGYDNFTFRVLFNAAVTRPRVNANGVPSGAIGGGIGGAVVVVVGATVVIIVWKKRSASPKSTTRPKGKHSGQIPDTMTSDGRDTENDEEIMIVINTYGTTGNAGTAQSTFGNRVRTAYEDVDIKDGSPKIDAETTETEKGVYAEGKKGPMIRNAADISTSDNDMYAVVNKGTKASNSKPEVKRKPDKTAKDGKFPKQKKEAKRGKRGAEYGNMPLTMKPMESSEYENFAFQQDDSSANSIGGKTNKGSSQSTRDDGLVYTTIQFTETQQKKAEETPPTLETTEYVSIAFDRHAPPLVE